MALGLRSWRRLIYLEYKVRAAIQQRPGVSLSIGIWALRIKGEENVHDLLAVSFVSQTGFLAINNEEVRAKHG